MNNLLDQSLSISSHQERATLSKRAFISNFGLQDGQNLYWTDSKHVELPVIVREEDNDIPLKTIP